MMKLLITGARGQLGQAFMAAAGRARIAHTGLSHDQLDILDRQAIAEALDREKPDFVINGAAISDVNAAQADATACYQVNRDGACRLAEACDARGIGLMYLSTDHVFDGQQAQPYTEDMKPDPQFVYGNSKYEGEEGVRELCTRHLILRSSWIFSHAGDNFLTRTLERNRRHEPVRGVSDQISCPTWAGHLAEVGVAMIQQAWCNVSPALWGTYHYCDRGATSRYEFVRAIVDMAERSGLGPAVAVENIESADLKVKPEVARHAVLSASRIFFTFGIRQRKWRDGLRQAVRQYREENPSVFEPPAEAPGTV